jgi:phage terminase large subunit
MEKRILIQKILSPKQGAAWQYLMDGSHTEVLYGGAAGGGKSWLGVLWLYVCAKQYPGSRYLMGRSVGKTLKETTLQSFFDVCAMIGAEAGEDYIYNQQSGTIAIGASTILLKDLFAYPSDPNFDDLGSLEITGAFIDEANQVSAKAKAIVSSRIRYKLDEFGILPKMLLTCNPARNWVHSEFYAPAKAGTLEPHRAFVPALVTDNPNISPHYIDNLKRLTGPDRARLLLGDWDYDADPSRLMEPDAIADLYTNDHVPTGDKYISADVARYGSDLTVISYWDGLRLEEFRVIANSATNATASEIADMARKRGVARSRIVVDDDGIGGGVVDLLPGCVPFRGGAKPIERKGKPENYANLKTQCSYLLAEMVNARELYIQPEGYHDRITEELAYVKRDKMDMDGKLRILGKDKIKEGIGRSPDFADVLMMRMVFELRPTPVGTDYLRAKGRRYAQEDNVAAIRQHFSKYKRP